MRILCDFLNRYLAPFMAGGSMAATTVLVEPSAIALALTIAVAFGFMSLPAGGRMIRRVAGVA